MALSAEDRAEMEAIAKAGRDPIAKARNISSTAVAITTLISFAVTAFWFSFSLKSNVEATAGSVKEIEVSIGKLSDSVRTIELTLWTREDQRRFEATDVLRLQDDVRELQRKSVSQSN